MIQQVRRVTYQLSTESLKLKFMTTVLHDSQLTLDQRKIIELRPDQNHLIMGPPGSGKTQVLLHRAKWLRDQLQAKHGEYVILVYTNVLGYFLKQALEFLGIPKENVRTFDDWCGEFWDTHVKETRPRTEKDKKGKSYVDFEAIRHRVWEKIREQPNLAVRLKFVLVDEGQDLDEASFGILHRCFKHITVFADARQQIFEAGASLRSMMDLIHVQWESATLLPAYRNSPDIAKLASYFGNPFDGLNYLATETQKPTLYYAEDWDDEIDHMAEVLRERRLQNHKCGILVPTKRDLWSVTKKLEERDVHVHKAIPPRAGGTPPDFDSLVPVIATYHSAKGLTFDCVLLPKLVENNFKKVKSEFRKRLLLVGVTRATQWVYLSTVKGYELVEVSILEGAANNGDLFLKHSCESDAKSPRIVVDPSTQDEDDDDEISFL